MSSQPENKGNLKLYKSEVRKIVARALGKPMPTDDNEPSTTFENHKEIKTVSIQTVEIKQSSHQEEISTQNGEVISHVSSSAESELKCANVEQHQSIEHHTGGNEDNGNLGKYKSEVQRIVARALGLDKKKNEDSESSSDFENKNQIKKMENNDSNNKLAKVNNENDENNTIMNVETLV